MFELPPPPQPGGTAGLLQNSQPWPPVDALPGVAANRGPRSALPLLAIIARVSLAIAVREAEEEDHAHDVEASAARSGDLQRSPEVAGVAAVGALLPAVCPPHQRYGPSGLGVVEPPRDEESRVALPGSERDSRAYVKVGVGP